MNALQKLEVLKKVYAGGESLDLIVDKLLAVMLNQHQLRLEQYDRDLRKFEERYGMDSATFYGRFEAGSLGDAMDWFEWAGLYELRQALQEKIRDLEAVL